MPLFFFLSGYTFKNGKSFYIFIKERTQRLIVPYILYNIVFIVAFTAVGYLENRQEIKNACIGAVYSRYCLYPYTSEYNVYFFTVYNGAMWFLTALFLSSILFYLIVEKELDLKIYIPAMLALLLGISYVMTKLPVLLPWSLDTAFIGAAFMVCGNQAKKRNIFSPEMCSVKNRDGIWILMTAVYIGLCSNNGSVNMSVRIFGNREYSILLFFLIGIIGSMLLLCLCKMLEFKKTGYLLAYIGGHSMEILILHLSVFRMVDLLMIRLFTFDLQKMQEAGLERYGYGVFKIAVTLCICLVYAKIHTFIKEKNLFKRHNFGREAE